MVGKYFLGESRPFFNGEMHRIKIPVYSAASVVSINFARRGGRL
jgi:hypothetical protein